MNLFFLLKSWKSGNVQLTWLTMYSTLWNPFQQISIIGLLDRWKQQYQVWLRILQKENEGNIKKEFIQFLYIAEGSLFEVLTLTEIFKRRKLIQDHEAKEIRKQSEIIDRKLHGLINSLRGRF